MKEEDEVNRNNISRVLPGECISHTISFTSPRDACSSSLVSSVFREASNSDITWERFLPHDYKEIISESSSSSSSLLNSLSKKDLYFHLCNHHILVGNGNLSFGLEKQSGKKCYMVGARGLSVAWGDTPNYWQWITLPESRFSEVAELKLSWFLDIKARIETKILSPQTTYAIYLVYQLLESKKGFDRAPIVTRINCDQSTTVAVHRVILDPADGMPPRARERGDGWMEIGMGHFFNEGNNAILECSVKEITTSKRGLIVEGIELRATDI